MLGCRIARHFVSITTSLLLGGFSPLHWCD